MAIIGHQQRYTGFVIGSDPAPTGNAVVWKVRVKDEGTPFNGRKLVVASTRDEVALAKGLNVNFLIGTVDDADNQEAPRAVDVCVSQPTSQLPRS